MTRGVRLYLVGSFVLVSLAGCGRGFFQSAEREPWRAEAEVACLKSGAVKETPELVRIEPISGPGVCGAQFPLKVAALGEGSSSFGFAKSCGRPEASATSRAGRSGRHLRRTVADLLRTTALRQPSYGAPSNGPISSSAPGVAQQDDEIDLPAEGAPQSRDPRGGGAYMAAPSYPSRDRYPSSTATVFTGTLFQAPATPLAAARAYARRSRQHGGAGRVKTDGDAGLSDRLGARPLARRIRCSRRRSAGSACAWSRSSRSPPIPAAA